MRAGHPSGHGTFEIMKIVVEKKGVNLENVHKVRAGKLCLALLAERLTRWGFTGGGACWQLFLPRF